MGDLSRINIPWSYRQKLQANYTFSTSYPGRPFSEASFSSTTASTTTTKSSVLVLHLGFRRVRYVRKREITFNQLHDGNASVITSVSCENDRSKKKFWWWIWERFQMRIKSTCAENIPFTYSFLFLLRFYVYICISICLFCVTFGHLR